MSGRDVIFVLGSGRSGTSAITRVLSLCGCGLPPAVSGAAVENPKGFWEPVEGLPTNFEFWSRYTVPGDPSMVFEDDSALKNEHAEEFVGKIRALLTAWHRGPALVVKCGGLTDLVQFWLEAARRGGFNVKVLIPFRNPQEVLASWGAFEGVSASTELLNATWLKLNLLAERHSRGLPRVFVEYPDLLKDWRTQVRRISSALSLDLKLDESAVDEFLTPSLHRQRSQGPITDTFAYAWISRVYSIFSAAGQNAPVDQDALDEIYAGYRTNERVFRIVRKEVSRLDMDPKQISQRYPVWVSGREF